ncbi:ATP-dependent RNA helicase HrpA [Rhodanobacter sp. DHB23]|uniref:ATP-dependent RNA helicase HrpA n=1 Tax=Rhodanobacter sp. DHB23 TaxID=2775923 RepID=UPI00177B125F|nr:ATP-dependent RNA helicase HrpA [Rhodanobacter sp. DHB23]MBD8872326.1 ATP-dependent RNA helicase HrpA [Rhodanobacter sp. DHB23]
MTDTNRPPSPQPTLRDLRRALDAVCSRDFGRLLGRWRGLSKHADDRRLAALLADIGTSAAKRRARAEAKPAIRLDESLPIAARADEIVKLIREHQVVVIAGETGSGKTTQIPKLCLAAGRGEAGLIGCTQPRRLAARSVARRVAEELGTQLGDQVGFQVRFTDQVSERTLVKFMTDGILLAETQNDPWLSAYDTLIIDEAHERSLNIDFLLGYLRRLAAKRPELKIIVTSATIDTARFAEHFGGAPVVSVEGRAYPVELRWRPVDMPAGAHPVRDGSSAPAGTKNDRAQGALPRSNIQQGSADHIAAVLDEIMADRSLGGGPGDVLVFLPGEREIRDTHLLLSRRQYRETEILPLYARLSATDQDRVFKPGPKRRVVLATNVAETSLTVPRIRYVVDTGSARVKRYSQRSQLERLHVEPVSQAAADQRKGRCGRIGPGICYRLYDEADFVARNAFTDPELLRSSLANVILRMLALKLGEVDDFPFLDAPDPRVVADGYRRLAEIGAIDEARTLTAIGRTLARLPIDVQLARMLVEAEKLHALRELITIAAFLSIQDPRERPADARQQADAAHAAFADPKSDFIGVLNLWREYDKAHEELTQSKLRDWCSRHFLSFMRMREWRELHRQSLLVVQELGWTMTSPSPLRGEGRGEGARSRGDGKNKRASHERSRKSQPLTPALSPEGRGSEDEAARQFEHIHRALLTGLPTQVGRKDERGIFQGTRERKFQVFPGSALAKLPPNWVFAAQILDVGGKVWAMMCARVEPAWIEQQAAHLLKSSCRDAHWSKKRGCVVAYEQVSLFGLNLVERRAVTFEKQDPALAHEIFLREALARGDIEARADFVRANQRVLEDAQGIEAKQRREGLIRHEDELVDFFRGKLPVDISSSRALDAWYRHARPAEQAALRWSLDDVMVGGAGLDPRAFPAALEIVPVAASGAPAAGAQRYRLEYRFVPGDDADGVTLHLPLAMLNALPAARCEWLVPGLLADKAAELIRGLPKALRRNFVPAPDFARAFAEAEAPRDEPLAKALAGFLKRATGVAIDAGEFAAVDLAPHFLMRFRVHDDSGRTLATGRDLAALRAEWEGRAREAFSRKTDVELTREDVAAWDFEEIPREVRSSGGLLAFPALVDLGDAVALRVFERRDEAAEAHVDGVLRLLRNALASELKQARRRLPIANPLALKYASLGGVDGLREDLVEGGFADLVARLDLDARSAGAFEALRTQAARELFGHAVERLKLAEPIIEAQAELRPWLQPPLMGFARASYDDLREQLDALLAPGFLRELPLARLAHYPRYLKAMRLRGERLRQDPAKDQQRMLQVLPYWREYLKHRAAGDGHLDELRWLIEEWRVSLFAQELKTAEPVSAKRLARALEAV